MRKTLAPLAVAALTLLLGCGYRAGGLFREDIRTVYVAGFDNTTFRRGLEVPLTRAITEEIRLRTPLLFASRDEADSILSGELMGADEDARIKSERGTILLQEATVKVRFRWRDRLTGADIVPEQTIVESSRVATPAAELGVGVGGKAVPADLIPQETSFELALQEAAQRVVEHMQANW